jgi:hypothetical protein
VSELFGVVFSGVQGARLRRVDCDFAPQARLRGDALYAAETQRDLDLSFTKKSTKWPGTALEPVPAPGGGPGEVKLTVGGHYGRGSASASANSVDLSMELPCPNTNSFVEGVVELNEPQWTALFGALRAAVIKEFKDELNDDLSTPTKNYANVKDLLFADTSSWREFLFTCDEVHIQSVGRRASGPPRPASGEHRAAGGEAFVAMPEHYDGGRGFIVLGISLWTTRIVRMWLSDGTVVDMKTEPGHCYLANFIGVRHQVLHAAAGAEAGRGYANSSVLNDFEVIYFARSAFFRYFKCSNQCRLWSGLEARLCACTCEAFSTWAATANIVLPRLEDVETRGELRKTRAPTKRRRPNPEGDVD